MKCMNTKPRAKSLSLVALVASGLVPLAASASMPVEPPSSVRASACELFVDKLTIAYSSHGLHDVRAYVKVRPEQLPAPIQRVGFYGRSHAERSEGGQWITRDSGWGDLFVAEPFLDANDYFKLSFPLGHDWASYDYEGVFFVELVNGARVWLNAERATEHTSGQNFRIDDRLYASLYRSNGRTPYDRMESAVPTQEHFTELNPRACR